jgi:hypothetical protein
MVTFAIFLTPSDPERGFIMYRSQRFSMVRTDEEGHKARFGPCAKELSRIAWTEGADLVRHGYDLNLDDCEDHTVTRHKGA